jgi:sulfhydrogenase subunit beta (sulfur reductase)
MPIPKSDIRALIGDLAAGAAVYVPVTGNGITSFERYGPGVEVDLDFTNSTVPPKHVLLPMLETLLCSRRKGDECGAPDIPANGGPVILFGARPCDARAFVLLDRVFGDGPKLDVYYTARRELLTVVSLGCTEPRDTCFCATTGGGPLSTEGSDILLEDTGDGYLVHVVTDRGRALAESHGLPDAGSAPAKARVTAVGAPSVEPPVDLRTLAVSLATSFEDPVWPEVARKCIGCGICSFLCPSCHCFDMVDEEASGVRVRNRIWDTCQFSCFTEQASGFNPRQDAAARYRQRVMHKFAYCPERYGMPGCTGCGRCVSECPVNLDIRRVMGAIGAGSEG